jgi:hypothetical protein
MFTFGYGLASSFPQPGENSAMEQTETHSAAGSGYYVWRFPGSPIRVHLALDVVRRLAKQLSSGAAEGLLFGKAGDGVTEVLDFQRTAGRVSEAITTLEKYGEKRLLVGYYRTEPGDILRLNDEDLLLARTWLPKSYHVLLLVQPDGSRPPSASFFFHGADGKMVELSLMEFPFEASLLAVEKRGHLGESELARKADIPPPTQLRAVPTFIALSAAGVLLPILGAGIAVNIPTLREWFLSRTRVERASPALPAAAASPAHPFTDGSIGLRARRNQGDVEISWNRNSPVIAAAQSGILSIQDGRVNRDIVLDATQVRNSNVIYAPTSEQVSFRLAIATEVNTVIESVILFVPKSGQPAEYPVPMPESIPTRPAQPSATQPLLKTFKPPSAAPSGRHPH